MSVKDFTEKWRLDTHAQEVPWGMTPAEQSTVMRSFAPKDPNYDVSPPFARFAHSIVHWDQDE